MVSFDRYHTTTSLCIDRCGECGLALFQQWGYSAQNTYLPAPDGLTLPSACLPSMSSLSTTWQPQKQHTPLSLPVVHSVDTLHTTECALLGQARDTDSDCLYTPSSCTVSEMCVVTVSVFYSSGPALSLHSGETTKCLYVRPACDILMENEGPTLLVATLPSSIAQPISPTLCGVFK